MADPLRVQVEDPTVGVATDFGPKADTLLVAFGGIKGGMGIAPFEFLRLASDVPTKRLFVRDLSQAWYQRGVPGLGETVGEAAAGLRTRIQESGARRVVMTGNSMGGFAALLFGAMCGADEVHAFSPQTFLGRWRRFRARDFRWREQIAAIHRRRPAGAVLDLRRTLRGWEGPGIVHYCTNYDLDRAHATRLRGLPGVSLRGHESGDHQLVRTLRASGELVEILRAALRG